MNKKNVVCSSAILGKDMHVNVYGTKGLPVVVFPTLAAAPESLEEVGIIDELADYLESGTIQLFCTQTVDEESWASDGDPEAQRRFSEPDTKVGPDTFRCALASAGAVVRAVDALFERSVRNAFCAVRPPGHHASRGRAAGFCYLNNVAIGALYAIRRFKLERVAIIDFDAHHGDGTEEIVAGNPKIRFFSIFQWPFYPNRRMEPTPMNVEAAPVEAGADGAVLREILETDWLPKLERFRPQFIFCSSGFDAHSEEPMAQLKATELDYAYLTRRLVEAATVVCEGRLVSVLEGGYSIGSLARSAVTHLQALLRTPEPS